MKQSFQALGKPQKFSSRKVLSEVLHGRLLFAATVAVPANVIGIVTGGLVQTETGSIGAGLLVMLLVANLLGILGLQILWAYLSRDLYQLHNANGWRRYQAVVHDLWPVHVNALIGALIINTFSMGLTHYGLEQIHHWYPKLNLNRYVPATAIAPIVGWFLLDAPFIRYMNDYYEKHVRTLAERYEDVVCIVQAQEHRNGLHSEAEPQEHFAEDVPDTQDATKAGVTVLLEVPTNGHNTAYYHSVKLSATENLTGKQGETDSPVAARSRSGAPPGPR